MKARIAAALLFCAMPALGPALAQAPFPPGWSAAVRTGCRVWNPAPQPTQSVSWTGECNDGYAEGSGVAQWLVSGVPSERYVGRMARGKPDGSGSKTYADGRRYQGEFVEGERSGKGTFSFPDKAQYSGEWRHDKPDGYGVFVVGDQTFKGTWRAGCLRDGQRLTWLETTQKECEAQSQ